jgi:hypothetical protein
MNLSMPAGFTAELYKKSGLLGETELPKDFDDFLEKFAFFKLPDLPEDIVNFIELDSFKDRQKPVKSMFFLPSENAVQMKLENWPNAVTLLLRIKDGKAELQEITFNQKEIKTKTLFKKNLKTIFAEK